MQRGQRVVPPLHTVFPPTTAEGTADCPARPCNSARGRGNGATPDHAPLWRPPRRRRPWPLPAPLPQTSGFTWGGGGGGHARRRGVRGAREEQLSARHPCRPPPPPSAAGPAAAATSTHRDWASRRASRGGWRWRPAGGSSSKAHPPSASHLRSNRGPPKIIHCQIGIAPPPPFPPSSTLCA